MLRQASADAQRDRSAKEADGVHDRIALPSISSEGNLCAVSPGDPQIPDARSRKRNTCWPSAGASTQDPDAAQRLVTSHLRLVAKIAMGYRGYGLPLSELISEGNVGMMQAVKRFDPDRGFRLATYAMWWIRASIQEYILHSWSLVKMGTTAAQKKLFFNLRKLKGQLQAIDEGDLSPENVAQDRHRAGRAGGRCRQHEPAAGGARPFAERAAAQRRRGRMAGLAGGRSREPGDQPRRARGAEPAPRSPARRHGASERRASATS